NFDIKIFDTLFSFGRARSINQLIINDENQILYKIDSIGPFNENEFLIQDTLISTCFINRMKVLFDSERTDLLYIIGNHDRRLIRQSKDGIELNSQLAYRRASWVDHLLKSEIPSIKNTETRIYQDCPKNLDKKMEPGYYLNDRFVKVIQVFSKTRSENY
ncbi:MAG: hypothetical protein NTV01_21145, partial [Bacteroidia bacterium]|nr:hypothetical protein [Bacteroidia bacterium]